METKKEKAGKGGKPKGRMSAYTYFVQTCREEHRKKHPNENVNFTEFSKKCAERWKVTKFSIFSIF
jgi:high mobility group protein B1